MCSSLSNGWPAMPVVIESCLAFHISINWGLKSKQTACLVFEKRTSNSAHCQSAPLRLAYALECLMRLGSSFSGCWLCWQKRQRVCARNRSNLSFSGIVLIKSELSGCVAMRPWVLNIAFHSGTAGQKWIMSSSRNLTFSLTLPGRQLCESSGWRNGRRESRWRHSCLVSILEGG